MSCNNSYFSSLSLTLYTFNIPTVIHVTITANVCIRHCEPYVPAPSFSRLSICHCLNVIEQSLSHSLTRRTEEARAIWTSDTLKVTVYFAISHRDNRVLARVSWKQSQHAGGEQLRVVGGTILYWLVLENSECAHLHILACKVTHQNAQCNECLVSWYACTLNDCWETNFIATQLCRAPAEMTSCTTLGSLSKTGVQSAFSFHAADTSLSRPLLTMNCSASLNLEVITVVCNSNFTFASLNVRLTLPRPREVKVVTGNDGSCVITHRTWERERPPAKLIVWGHYVHR